MMASIAYLCMTYEIFDFIPLFIFSLSTPCSIDPIHIDDPLFPTNNVGRNCFRIHQCIKVNCVIYWLGYHGICCQFRINLCDNVMFVESN